jgi:SAM-dependent methyltransferase
MTRPHAFLQTLREAAGPRFKRKPILRGLWYAASSIWHRLALVAQSRRERSASRPGRPLVAGGWPLPPPDLRYRVHGSLDVESFVQVGERSAADVVAVLEQFGVDPAACVRLLDFGCGCGRVLCHLPRKEDSDWHGVDIDPEAIAWVQRHLPDLATWSVNSWLPPAPLPTASFDLILALSVFSHLDEPVQLAWLHELRRLAAPGGWLLASVHGPTAHDALQPTERAELRRSGFYFKQETRGWLKRDRLPDGYQAAYHEADYIREVWGQLFEVVAYVPQGLNRLQDAVLLRRPSEPSDDPAGVAAADREPPEAVLPGRT